MSETSSKDTVSSNRKPLKDICQVFSVDETSEAPPISSQAPTSHSEKSVKCAKKGKWSPPSLAKMPSMPASLFFLAISFILQLLFTVYLVGYVIHSVDSHLLYSIGFLVLNLGATFWAFELLLNQSKNLLLCSFLCSSLLMVISTIILVLMARKEDGKDLGSIETLIAITIMLQFVHLLGVVHFSFDKKRNGKNVALDDVLPCACRPCALDSAQSGSHAPSSSPGSACSSSAMLSERAGKSAKSPKFYRPSVSKSSATVNTTQSSGNVTGSNISSAIKSDRAVMKYIIDSTTGESRPVTSL